MHIAKDYLFNVCVCVCVSKEEGTVSVPFCLGIFFNLDWSQWGIISYIIILVINIELFYQVPQNNKELENRYILSIQTTEYWVPCYGIVQWRPWTVGDSKAQIKKAETMLQCDTLLQLPVLIRIPSLVLSRRASFYLWEVKWSHSVMSNSLRPHGL